MKKLKKIEFYCCEQGNMYIQNISFDGYTGKTNQVNPYLRIHEIYDDWDGVEINFCPWCGKKASIK